MIPIIYDLAEAARILGFSESYLRSKLRDRTFAGMKRAAADLYDEVRVTTVLDQEATRANLDKIINKLAGEIQHRDTFILFAAAHGIAENGRFYLIPQDYDGGTNPASLQERAIGQDRLQDWVAR